MSDQPRNQHGITTWKHVVRTGAHCQCSDSDPEPDEHREAVEPWLSALFQAEHFNVLIGSGFTTAVASLAGVSAVDMSPDSFECGQADAVMQAACKSAKHLGRKEPNIEDQMRAVIELIGGLRILAGDAPAGGDDDGLRKQADDLLQEWTPALEKTLSSFLKKILATERGIDKVITDTSADKADRVRRLLQSFLLPFGSRVGTRERTHIFTTNYDRLVEYGCDLLGLRVVDRFVGNIAPVFRSSRLGIDLHYNPPGIRGEPRYLEGVVRFTKLHGSVDWRSVKGPSGRLEIQRRGLPFDAGDNHPDVPGNDSDRLLIYPNAAKDVETLEFPYAELFRDFAAAVCQPNAVVVTYGYGFGDDHVNRVLLDMLSIPSTHLVIISWDDADGRIPTFHDRAGHEAQVSLLIGDHFGDLETLTEHYLPKPAIDRTTSRMVDLLYRRGRLGSDTDGPGAKRRTFDEDPA